MINKFYSIKRGVILTFYIFHSNREPKKAFYCCEMCKKSKSPPFLYYKKTGKRRALFQPKYGHMTGNKAGKIQVLPVFCCVQLRLLHVLWFLQPQICFERGLFLAETRALDGQNMPLLYGFSFKTWDGNLPLPDSRSGGTASFSAWILLSLKYFMFNRK